MLYIVLTSMISEISDPNVDLNGYDYRDFIRHYSVSVRMTRHTVIY
jgi:hypothetical protein